MSNQPKNHAQPRPVEVRKPLRPVRVAAARQPVKTTAPIVLGAGRIILKPFATR